MSGAPQITVLHALAVVGLSLAMGAVLVWALLFAARREALSAARRAADAWGVEVRHGARRAAVPDGLDD